MSFPGEADKTSMACGINPFGAPARGDLPSAPLRTAAHPGPPGQRRPLPIPPRHGPDSGTQLAHRDPMNRSGYYPVPAAVQDRPMLFRTRPTGAPAMMLPLAEPPAGLGRPGSAPVRRPGSDLSMGGYPSFPEEASLSQYWWVAALVVVAVLGALGIGTWALLGGGAADGDYQWLNAHGLNYRIPRSWTSQDESDVPWVRPIHAQGVGTGAQFVCGGQQHARASVGVMEVYRKDNQPPRPQDAARDLGMSYAATVYGADAPARISDPVPLEIGRVPAETSMVTVRPAPSGSCRVGGQLTVIALPSHERGPGDQATLRVFILQRDTTGGPGSAPVLTTGEVRQILSDIRVTGN